MKPIPNLAAGAVLAAIMAFPAVADSPRPFPEFTFKREKPPKPGARKRITVQIDPEEQAKSLATAQPAATSTPAATPAAVPGARYGWFWTKVTPDAGADAAVRLRLALDSLDDGPNGARVAGPRLQTLQSIARVRGADILRSTIGTDVSPALVLAVIAVESGGKVEAESSAGAQGLMQLMPDTATRFGVTDSLSSAQNIKGGVAYLDWLLKEFDGDAVLALAGYNAGEGAVRSHSGVPPYAETRDYVPKVLAAFEVARGLCKTRPELITDACALNLASN